MMRALGQKIGEIGALVPGTHCAAAASAAAASMPAAAAKWASGKPDGAVGYAVALVYDACTTPPVWKLAGFLAVALYGP
jgi:hypothetical protein